MRGSRSVSQPEGAGAGGPVTLRVNTDRRLRTCLWSAVAALLLLAVLHVCAFPSAALAQNSIAVSIEGGSAVTEGLSASFTLSASATPATDLVIGLTCTDSGDFARDDPIDIAEGNRTITAGATTRMFTVPTENDLVDEDDGTVTCTVVEGTGYTPHATDDSDAVIVVDNDVRGILLVPDDMVTVQEGSEDAEAWTVSLATQPTEEVVVTLTGEDASQGLTVSTTSHGTEDKLTFTPENWSTPQHVAAAAAVDTNVYDEMVTILHTASGGDYDATTRSLALYSNDTAEQAIEIGGSFLGSDGIGHEVEGQSSKHTYRLASNPSGNVTVTVSSTWPWTKFHDSSGNAVLDSVTLTFAPEGSDGKWDIPQEVHYTHVADLNDQTDYGFMDAEASGANYDGVLRKDQYDIQDRIAGEPDFNVPGLIEVDGNEMNEGDSQTQSFNWAGTGTVRVTYVDLKDTGTIEVDTGSTDAGGNPIFTFTDEDTDNSQSFTLTAVEDDNATDGRVDVYFHEVGGIREVHYLFIVNDNDQPEVVFEDVPALITLAEGTTRTYGIKLGAAPTSTVEVDITVEGNGVAVSTASHGNAAKLAFSAQNWNQTQTVTVHAPLDEDGDDEDATLVHTWSSGDPSYSRTDSIAVKVTDVNAAPGEAAVTDQTVTVGESFSYSFDEVTDPDAGQTLTYAVRLAGGGALPDWLSFDASSRTFSGEPAREDIGTSTIRITVTDNGTPPFSSVADFNLTVVATNPGLPTDLTLTAGDGQIGASWTVPTDNGGGALTGYDVAYKLAAENNWTDAGHSGTGVTATLDQLVNGRNYNVRVRAVNNANKSSSWAEESVSLNRAPQPPTIDPAPTATVGKTLDWTLPAFTDDDTYGSDSLTYAATDSAGDPLPDWLSFDTATRKFSGTPPDDAPTSISIKATATDSGEPAKSGDVTFALGIGKPVVSIAGDGAVTEGTAASFTLTISPSLNVDRVIALSCVDSGDFAAADPIVVAASARTISDGDTTKTFTVATDDDEVDEPDGKITCTLADGTGYTRHDTKNSAEVQVQDNESQTATLKLDPESISENGGSTTVSATLSVASSEAVTLTVSAAAVSPAVAADFTLSENTTLTIATGETSSTGTVTITGNDNNVAAGDKTVTVSAAASGGNGVSDPDDETLTLTDDDTASDGFSLSVSPATAAEKADATEVTVTATLDDAALTTAKTITLALAGTAVKGTDYADVAPGSITIAAGSTTGSVTFSIDPTDDALAEGDETVLINGTAAGLEQNDGAEFTITDDETVSDGFSLSVSTGSVTEAAGSTELTVTATLDEDAFPVAKTITLALAGTAVKGTDYADVTPGSIIIAAGSTSGEVKFRIDPSEDTIAEGDETVLINGTASGLTQNSGAEFTITDNDTASDGFSLTVSPATAGEKAAATEVTVTATLDDAAFTTAKTITLALAGTAVKGTDYGDVAPGSITIAAGSKTGSVKFSIDPTDDALGEGDETVLINGTAAGLEQNDGAEFTITDDETVSDGFSLSVSPGSATEAAGSTELTVTATLDEDAFPEAKTITLALAGTAVKGTDYADVTPGSITIAEGQTSASVKFSIDPTEDTIAEGDETVLINGTASGLTQNSAATFTIADNDTASDGFSLSVSPSTAGEKADATEVTVTAALDDAAFTTAKTITLALAGTAMKGEDYADVAPGSITIAAGSKTGSVTFSIDPTDDALGEGDETVVINGTAAGLEQNDGAEFTITDDETVSDGFGLSVSPGSATEAAGSTELTVTATLDEDAFPAAKTITLALAGTAVKGTDYADVTPGSITIPAGQTSASVKFSIDPFEDTIAEGNETVLIDGTSAGLTQNSGAEFTITDNDTASDGFSLTVSPGNAGEKAGATEVTVTAALDDAAFTTAKTITLALAGTAVKGTDYADVAPGSITIAAGSKTGSVTFSIDPTDDALAEGDETVLINGTAAGLEQNDGAEFTITDDETISDGFSLSVLPGSATEAAGSTELTVTATLDEDAFPEAKTITLALAGTAVKGTDYADATPGSITIAAGSTSGEAKFSIDPSEDTIAEGNETVLINGTASGLTQNSGATFTITDNDTASDGFSLTVSPATAGEKADATEVTVTATLDDAAFTTAKTITLALAGTAVKGTDYADVAPGSITIAAGSKAGSVKFSIDPIDDALGEGDETVVINGTAAGLDQNDGAEFTITDDETVSDGFGLSVSPGSATEDAGSTELTVTATLDEDAFPAAKTITLALAGTAVKGTDYADVTPGSITIAAGQTSASVKFSIDPSEDMIAEGNETVLINGMASGLTQNSAAEFTITDNDTASDGFSLSVSPTTAGEKAAATEVTVTATLDDAAFTTAKTITLTLAGTAVKGTDYADVTPGSITIAAGSKTGSVTFSIDPTDDALGEGDETVVINGTAAGLDQNDGATFTITDDETVSDGFSLSVSPSSAAETADATEVTVTATLDGSAFPGAKTVSLTLGGTATKGVDYADVTPGSITIAAGATKGSVKFNIDSTDDILGEGDETVVINGTAAGLEENESATFTITDDDTASDGFSLSVSPATAAEKAGATEVTVTATLDDAAFTTAKTITLALAGTAVKGTDYADVTPGSITIAAGSSSGQVKFSIDPTDDALGEGDETVVINGTAVGLTQNSSATFTITDDETVSDGFSLSVSPGSVTEAAGSTELTVTATLDEDAFPEAKTITLALAGTAVKGTDYADVTPGSITIGAGQTSASVKFSIDPTEDTIAEGDETVLIDGTSAGLTQNSDAELTITDNDTASDGFRLTVSPGSAGEKAGATEVTVTATLDDAAFTTAKTITLALAGTAVKGKDYADVAPGSITIAAGQASGLIKFSIDPTDDVLAEGDETVLINGTATGLTQNSGATFTITDDETVSDGFGLSISPGSATEAAGSTALTVTATLDEDAFPEAKTITLALAGTAVKGTDYADVAPGSITVAAGSTSGQVKFSIDPSEDTIAEGDETVLINGTSSGLTQNSAATFTITDNDTASDGFSLSVSPTTAGEKADATEVTVTATLDDAAFTTAKTITLALAGTAVKGTDYADVTPGSITIAAGSKTGSVTFSIDPTDDALGEGDEMVVINGTAAGLEQNDGAEFTITDDETVSDGFGLSVSPGSATEAAGSTELTVTATLDGAAFPAAKTITLALAGTAVKGTDYADVTPGSITIAEGRTSASVKFSIDPTEDTLAEGDETVVINGAAAGLAQNDGATFTITDNDIASDGFGLSVSPGSATEAAGSTELTVTATLDGGSFTTAKTIALALAGTAVKGTDYADVTPGSIMIAAGSISGEVKFSVDPTEDVLAEGDETVLINGTAAGLEQNSGAAFTITDNDIASDGFSLSVSPASATEAAGSTELTVTATLDGSAFTTATTITLALAGTAVKGVDYTDVAPGSITIAAGSTSGAVKFSVDPTEDALAEGDETVVINGAAAGLEQNSGATFTIMDNDTASDGFSLSVSPSSATEAAGSTELTVTAALDGSAFTTAKTIALTLAGTAVKGVDYADVAPGSITIAAGSTTGSVKFSIDPAEDALAEGDESVVINGTAAGLEQNDSAEFIITDNDTASDGFGLSVSPASATEAAGSTELTVTAALDGSAFATAKTITLTLAGTAVKGVDYADVAPGSITIAAGSTTGSVKFSIDPAEDSLAEGDETVLINGAAAGLEQNGGAVFTITDNDTRGVTISSNELEVREDGGTGTYTVVLTSAPTAAVTVAASSNNTDAATVSPQSLTFTAGDWSAAQTVTVTGAEDAHDNNHVSATISHTVFGGDYQGIAADSVAVTVLESNPGGITDPIDLTVSPDAVSEGGGPKVITVTAVIAGEAVDEARTVTVQVGASGDPAVEGEDYEKVADVLLEIPADELSGSTMFTLTPVDDSSDEGLGETISISGMLTGTTVRGTEINLKDDDISGVTVSPSEVEVQENGGTATYMVALTAAPAADVTVMVTSGDNTAAKVHKSGGVAGKTAVLTFTADDWETAQAVTVTGVNDSYDNENNERMTAISHTASGGGYDGVSAGDVTVTVTDDDEAAEIRLSLSPDSVAEDTASAQRITVTAAIAGSTRFATAQDVAVMVGAPGGSATEGEDYAAVSDFTITIPEGGAAAEGVFEITPVPDDVDEGSSESVSVDGTLSGVAVNGATLEITDDDMKGLVVAPAEVSVEEGSTASWNVKLSSQPDAAVTVRISGEAHGLTVTTPDNDSEDVLVFAAEKWDQPKVVTVRAAQDANMASETATFAHTASGGSYDGAAASAVVSSVDTTLPVTLSLAEGFTPPLSGPFDITITFHRPVTGFTQDDLEIRHGSVTAFDGSDADWTATITPDAGITGTVTIEVPADAAQSDAGHGNQAAEPLAVAVDGVPPTVTVTSDAPELVNDPFEVVITFSEDVRGFDEAGDIFVTGGMAGVPEAVPAGQTRVYRAVITPDATEVSVTVLADVAHDAAGNGNLAAPEAVMRRTTLPRAVLAMTREMEARHALTIADNVASAIDERMEETANRFSTPGYPARPGEKPGFPAGSGQGAWGKAGGDESWNPIGEYEQAGAASSTDALLSGMSLTIPFAEETDARNISGFWVRGTSTGLSGDGWDGTVNGAQLGIDGAVNEAVRTGLLLSLSSGSFEGQAQDYAFGYSSRMNSVHPWVAWTPGPVRLWTSAGWGSGTVEVRDPDEDGRGRLGRHATDTELKTLSASVSGPVFDRDGLTVEVRGVGMAVSVDISGNDGLVSDTIAAHRLRASVQGRWDGVMASGVRVAPSLELGVRSDGGDIATSLGEELGAGLAVRAGRVSVDGGVRLVLSEGEIVERGFSGSLGFGRGGGQGLMLDVRSVQGSLQSRMWEEGITAFADDAPDEVRTSARLGYGFASGGGVLTPWTELLVGGEGGSIGNTRFGVNYRFLPAFDVGIESSSYGVGVRGSLRW